jgi:hypothetical protein
MIGIRRQHGEPQREKCDGAGNDVDHRFGGVGVKGCASGDRRRAGFQPEHEQAYGDADGCDLLRLFHLPPAPVARVSGV